MLDYQSRRRLVAKHLTCALSTTMLLAAVANPARGQNAAGPAGLIASGQQQQQAARKTNTEAAYRQAETTFDQAVQLDAQSATARLYRGLARLELT